MKYKVGDMVYLRGLKGTIIEVKNKGFWVHEKQMITIEWGIGSSEISNLNTELKPLITLPAII